MPVNHKLFLLLQSVVHFSSPNLKSPSLLLLLFSAQPSRSSVNHSAALDLEVELLSTSHTLVQAEQDKCEVSLNIIQRYIFPFEKFEFELKWIKVNMISR